MSIGAIEGQRDLILAASLPLNELYDCLPSEPRDRNPMLLRKLTKVRVLGGRDTHGYATILRHVIASLSRPTALCSRMLHCAVYGDCDQGASTGRSLLPELGVASDLRSPVAHQRRRPPACPRAVHLPLTSCPVPQRVDASRVTPQSPLNAHLLRTPASNASVDHQDPKRTLPPRPLALTAPHRSHTQHHNPLIA